ncbi:hypothetical protein HPP92_007367 [Vanilla planifolia]|uniref:ASCH domain-containing protein n=1 Tax=Vanilla planifolia TaxID=51239 RepID=A0A835RG11_VANPL|nr:hypothetical protein HPP92_007367 [Vanilla planifolia]
MNNSSYEPTPAPPSPGSGPVRLSDCIEALLRLSLSAPSDAPSGLSREYCDRLLQDDPFPSASPALHVGGGVPPYPLYKPLARAIEGCRSSGTAFRETVLVTGLSEDDSLKEKRKKWDRMILETGAELIMMMESMDFELHVQEPFFSQLRAELKTVEGRCATEDYKRIKTGALLIFNESLVMKVQDVRFYSSFFEMLQVELANALPGIQTIEEGVQIYRKFYTEDREKRNGVLAIHVSQQAFQPYVHLGRLISDLGYEGISSLLGMMHSTGTIPEALSPPRTALLLSSMKLHRPDIDGSSLTDAARSLAKHSHRNRDGWWGSFCGSDSEKNRLALEHVQQMLNDCCWMNIYMVQPHGVVFEVRLRLGFGARWSMDGSKFIGFLEPYTEEGRAKG